MHPTYPRTYKGSRGLAGTLSRIHQHEPGGRVPHFSRVLCARSGVFAATSVTPSPRLVPNLFLPPLPVVDPNQPILAIRVRSVTAPLPVVGFLHQSPDHRVPVHVFQLLHLFPLTPHIEVIKPALPELPGCPPAPGKPKFHGLHNRRRIADLRLRNQHVNVLRHHHIPDYAKAIPLAHHFQDIKEQVSCWFCIEQRPAPIAAPGNEVEASGTVVALQAPWHEVTVDGRAAVWR